MSNPLYPLRFEPLFRRYIWGGRRLASVLDKMNWRPKAGRSSITGKHRASLSLVNWLVRRFGS